MKPRRLIDSLPLLIGAVLCGCHGAEPPMTTLAPKSDLGEWIYRLFLEVTAWDALIFAIVVVAFILAVFVFSTRVGEAGPPAPAGSALGLEVAWTVGPALVILMISIPTVRTVFRSQPAVAPKGALEIDVTAHQWWWEFHYAGSGVAIGNELHIPAGRPIRLRLRSADIIHSFWVPQLGGKRDVVPGQTNELTFVANVPGTYLGQCAEFCGLSHANMRLRVIVDSQADFAKWEKAQQAAAAVPIPTTPVGIGAQIFANSPCTTCHAITGVSKGYIGPDLTHMASRHTLAAGLFPNDPDHLAKWIIDPEAMKPGAEMPGFGIGRDQLHDLVAYLESLK